MTARTLAADEVTALVDELWLPFAREMAAAEPHDAPADESAAREQAVVYRRGRVADDEVVTYVVPAGDGGTFAAYAEAEVRASPPVSERGAECYLRGVYVRPGDRGRGLADGLLDRVEAWGRERGCEHVTLDVHPGNDAAKALYEGRGYELLRAKLALAL